MKNSNFRQWVMELWMRHKDERFYWNELTYLELQDYWNKYKWWIKREFRYKANKK